MTYPYYVHCTDNTRNSFICVYPPALQLVHPLRYCCYGFYRNTVRNAFWVMWLHTYSFIGKHFAYGRKYMILWTVAITRVKVFFTRKYLLSSTLFVAWYNKVEWLKRVVHYWITVQQLQGSKSYSNPRYVSMLQIINMLTFICPCSMLI